MIFPTVGPYKLLHFTGCYAFAFTVWQTGLNVWWGAGVVAVIAVGWQMLDAANQTHSWKIPALNPAGGDARALWIDAVGILSACLLKISITNIFEGLQT